MTPPAVHFLAPELTRWDTVTDLEALALSFFADERPLRGAAGLVDWRLCGRLSRLLKGGRLVGKADEALMLPPPRGRLTAGRIVLFGLGESAAFDEARYRASVRRIRDVLERAGVRRYAVQPPGRATGLIAARRALDVWLDEAQRDGYPADATIIETPSGQKEMAESLRSRTSR